MAEKPTSLLPAEIDGLTFSSDDGQTLINELQLNLQSEAISAIMGPNGAGKSLLLRLLHGLVSPTSGTIRWGGHSMNDAIRRRQAMVFQRPVMLRRSVAANIDFALKLRGTQSLTSTTGARRGRSRGPCEPTGKIPFRRRTARLALARALATETGRPFWMNRQPTSIRLRPPPSKTSSKAAEKSGTKIVLVSHDLGQARRLVMRSYSCTAVALSNKLPHEFFESPNSQQGRDFLAGVLVL